MFKKIKKFFAPPVFEDEEKMRTAYLLNIVTWIYLGLAIVGTLGILSLFGSDVEMRLILFMIAIRVLPFLTANIIGQILMRLGYVRPASMIFVALLWVGYTAVMYVNGGIQATAFSFYFLLILIAGLLLGSRATTIVLVLSIFSGTIFLILDRQGALPEPSQSNDAVDLIALSLGFVITATILYLFVRSLNEAMERAQKANIELQAAGNQLEERVIERTRDLAVAAEIGRALSQIQDMDQLLNQSVNLIRDRYDLYYTQIYLTTATADGLSLTLRAGTGDTGRHLLQNKHNLPVAVGSINGMAAAEKRSALVADTAVSDIFRPHPYLPDTRSELAVPLIVGERVIGTLDMQSSAPNTFNKDSLPVFETLAGQLAIAIENANLFVERQYAEKAALRSQERFEAAVRGSNVGIWDWDLTNDDIYYSPYWKNILGYADNEITNQFSEFETRLHPDDRQRVIGIMNDALEGKSPFFEIEFLMRHKNDSYRWILSRAEVAQDVDGAPSRIAGSFMDITERKEAEGALAERVAQLNLLNEIGRKMDQTPPVSEFLQWTAERIPRAMHHAEDGLAAIHYQGEIYGDPNAANLANHIVEGLRVWNERAGQIVLAYRKGHPFRDEDSALIGGLGQRIAAYLETRQLFDQAQARAAELQTVAEVGTAVAAILEGRELLKTVVNLIQERFNLYHVHVLLMDELNHELVTAAGSSEIGSLLEDELGNIQLNDPRSVVARAARERGGVIVRDTRLEENFMSHDLLPDTRSELAVPMVLGESLLGILDLQSEQPAHFNEESLVIYATLAAQIAVALQNARQYEQAETALQELETLRRIASQEGWQLFLSAADREIMGYTALQGKVEPVRSNGKVAATEHDADKEKEMFITPMKVRGASIGRIGVRANTGKISAEDQALLESVSKQVAEALERARLLEETELGRHQTEMLYDIGRILPTIETSAELLQTIADSAAESINADSSMLLLFDVEQERILQTVVGGADRAHAGMEIPYASVWRGLSGWALRENKPAFSSKAGLDKREDPDIAERRRAQGVGAVIVTPLIYQNKILGTLTVVNKIQRPDFTQSDVDLLTAIGVQATVAIENRNLLDETQKRAVREQTLREITNRVNTAVDAESVLKTAVQEVGRAMGLEIFAYLDENSTIESGTNASIHKTI